MKKNIIMKLFTVILMISFLTGCARPISVKVNDSPTAADNETGKDSGEVVDVSNDLPDTGTVVRGITVNKINFEVVDVSTLSEQLQNEIEALKQQRGYEFWLQEDGSYYILISSGEKSTGGYGIEVNSIEDNEGRTVIAVTETAPGADEMTAQIITYPFVVVKASGITENFMISDQHQNEYSRITADAAQVSDQTMLRIDENAVDYSQPILGTYQGLVDNHSIEVLVGDKYMVFSADDIAKYVEGFNTGDDVKIIASISPSDQIVLESIERLQK
jgi:hypothetical protein